MADKTLISWSDATWNPITGCSLVSPGCTNCYAMKIAGGRLKHHHSRQGLTTPSKAGPVWNGKVRINEDWLGQPLRWQRPRTIFVCAHGDLFHEDVPDEWISKVWAVMETAHWHTFQVLTKRPQRMRRWLPEVWYTGKVLPNVWLGVSAEDQERADERIPVLLEIPAAVRFLSAEPLLGPIDLTRLRDTSETWLDAVAGRWGRNREPSSVWTGAPSLDWVIVGGESGPGARPMHPAWARSLRDQCAADGVPFHFKQWGEWAPVEDLRDFKVGEDVSYDGENGEFLRRVGKKRAGRLLDGRTWDGSPA